MCFTKGSEVDLAETIIMINASAFKQAPNIVNVYFPNSVTSIASSVFQTTNNKLETIKIGPNVTSIHPNFKFHNYYGTVIIDDNNHNYFIDNNELYNKDKTELITVLYEIHGQYIVRDSVTKICFYAFHSQNNMSGIVLPDNLKEIETMAFVFCDNVTSIYIPNSVETIAYNAFASMNNLQQIQIDKEPGSITGSSWGAIRGDRIVEWLR